MFKGILKNIKDLPPDARKDLQRKVNKIRRGEFFPDRYRSKKDCYKMRVGEKDTHRAFFKMVNYEGETVLILEWVKPRKDAY